MMTDTLSIGRYIMLYSQQVQTKKKTQKTETETDGERERERERERQMSSIDRCIWLEENWLGKVGTIVHYLQLIIRYATKARHS